MIRIAMNLPTIQYMSRLIALTLVLTSVTIKIEAQQKPLVVNKKLIHPETLEVIKDGMQLIYVHDDGTVAMKDLNFWTLTDYSGKPLIDKKILEQPSFYKDLLVIKVEGIRSNTKAYRPAFEVYNRDFELILRNEVFFLGRFRDGIAPFKQERFDGYGLMDLQGKVLMKTDHGRFNGIFSIGKERYIVFKNEKNWGMVNLKNEEILPFKYDEIDHQFEDIFILKYIDPDKPYTVSTNPFSKGDHVPNYAYKLWSPIKGFLSEEYGLLYPDASKRAQTDFIAKGKGKNDYGLIDKTGKTIIPLNHAGVKYLTNDLVALGKWNDQLSAPLYALAKMDGTMLSQYILAGVGEFKNGLLGVGMVQGPNLRYGFIDRDIQIKVPLIYDYARDFDDHGMAVVGMFDEKKRLGNSWGAINAQNVITVPILFSRLERISEKYFKGRLEGSKHEYIIDAQTGHPMEKDQIKRDSLYRKYGNYYFQAQKYGDAARYFSPIVSDASAPSTEDLVRLGASLGRDGKLNEGVKYLDRALEQVNSVDTEIHAKAVAEKAHIFAKGSQPAQAEALYNQAISLTENNGDIRLEFADYLAEMKSWSKAIEQYQEILKAFPTAAFVYDKLGIAQVELGQEAQAITSFTTSIQHNSNNFEPYYYRGQLYQRSNQIDQAIADYEKSVSLHQDEVNAIHINLASAYFTKGNKNKACELWKKLERFDKASKNNLAEHCK